MYVRECWKLQKNDTVEEKKDMRTDAARFSFSFPSCRSNCLEKAYQNKTTKLMTGLQIQN